MGARGGEGRQAGEGGLGRETAATAVAGGAEDEEIGGGGRGCNIGVDEEAVEKPEVPVLVDEALGCAVRLSGSNCA